MILGSTLSNFLKSNYKSSVMAVEVEVEYLNERVYSRVLSNLAEAAKQTNKVYNWTAKNDGSLRNFGIEWVSTKPKQLPVLEQDILDLVSAMKPEVNNIVETRRTSVHVHMNITHLKVLELYNAAARYYLCEQALFMFAANQSRANNLFCVSSSGSINNLRVLARTARNWEPPSRTNEYQKYSSFNFETMRRFGTVESRILKGVYDERLIPWCRILSSIVYHPDNSKTTPSLLVRSAFDNPLEFFKDSLGAPGYHGFVENSTPPEGFSLEDSIVESINAGLSNVMVLSEACEWDDSKDFRENPFVKKFANSEYGGKVWDLSKDQIPDWAFYSEHPITEQAALDFLPERDNEGQIDAPALQPAAPAQPAQPAGGIDVGGVNWNDLQDVLRVREQLALENVRAAQPVNNLGQPRRRRPVRQAGAFEEPGWVGRPPNGLNLGD